MSLTVHPSTIFPLTIRLMVTDLYEIFLPQTQITVFLPADKRRITHYNMQSTWSPIFKYFFGVFNCYHLNLLIFNTFFT